MFFSKWFENKEEVIEDITPAQKRERTILDRYGDNARQIIGKKAAETNKLRYGNDFYVNLGGRGGSISRGGGFTNNPELARIAGSRGGKVSRRGKANAQSE